MTIKKIYLEPNKMAYIYNIISIYIYILIITTDVVVLTSVVIIPISLAYQDL